MNYIPVVLVLFLADVAVDVAGVGLGDELSSLKGTIWDFSSL